MVNKTRVEIKIDGNELRLNAFVQKLLSNTLFAMIMCLDGVGDNPKHVILSVTKKGEIG
jgi:hypothetical protein